MKYLYIIIFKSIYLLGKFSSILIKFIINIMSFISSENVDLYLFTCFPLISSFFIYKYY